MNSRRRVNSDVVRLPLSSMARLDVKFPDGSHLLQEPRGEDPLVYYLPDGDWSRGVAVEILPLYEERKATVASIRFSEDHVERLQSLQDTDLLLIIQRFAVTLRVTSLGGKN